MRKHLRTPFGWAAIGAAATILPMAVPNGSLWAVSLAALTLYSLGVPLWCALRNDWWRDTFLTGFGWVVIFVIVGVMPGTKALREGAMVFLLPMMVYPIALAVSGVIRMIRWRMKRAPQPPPVLTSP